MHLDGYLRRIGYSGQLTPSLQTLNELHRAHLRAIPYENLDIHLGKQLTLDLDGIFEKLVMQNRGGWCFEMNGLFAWALEELGFKITRLASSVGRHTLNGNGKGDHLILLVHLNQRYLADVGFGAGFLEPLPFVAGTYRQGPVQVALKQHAGRWIFENDPNLGPGYDFDLVEQSLGDFAPQNHWLQTSSDSGFVKLAVCQSHRQDEILSLRGAVFKVITAAGISRTVLDSKQKYQEVVQKRFGIDLVSVDALWEKIWSRHQAWMRENPDALS